MDEEGDAGDGDHTGEGADGQGVEPGGDQEEGDEDGEGGGEVGELGPTPRRLHEETARGGRAVWRGGQQQK